MFFLLNSDSPRLLTTSGIKNSHLLNKPSPVCALYKLNIKTGSVEQHLGKSDVVRQEINPKYAPVDICFSHQAKCKVCFLNSRRRFREAFEVAFDHGQEDHIHLMIKFRDGEAESGPELGTCLVLQSCLLAHFNSACNT